MPGPTTGHPRPAGGSCGRCGPAVAVVTALAVAPVIAAWLPAADALELVRPVHISIGVLTLAGMLFVRCLAGPRR